MKLSIELKDCTNGEAMRAHVASVLGIDVGEKALIQVNSELVARLNEKANREIPEHLRAGGPVITDSGRALMFERAAVDAQEENEQLRKELEMLRKLNQEQTATIANFNSPLIDIADSANKALEYMKLARNYPGVPRQHVACDSAITNIEKIIALTGGGAVDADGFEVEEAPDEPVREIVQDV